MRVISLNANGIRSATNKGALDWLSSQEADVICLQELKAQIVDLQPQHQALDCGLLGHFACAQKKGTRALGSTAGPMPRWQPDLGWLSSMPRAV